MTDLRDKIAGVIWHDRLGYNTVDSVADAILALPETAGWTALEAATEELLNNTPPPPSQSNESK